MHFADLAVQRRDDDQTCTDGEQRTGRSHCDDVLLDEHLNTHSAATAPSRFYTMLPSKTVSVSA